MLHFDLLTLFPDLRSAFWGMIDGGLRKIFLGSMLLAAGGYLLFLYWTLLKLGHDAPASQWFIESYWPSILVGIFLAFSTIWMPLTTAFLKTGNQTLWESVVGVLWIVAISLWALFFLIITQSWREGGWTSFLGTVGLFYIAVHCTILDAVIWVNRFSKTSP